MSEIVTKHMTNWALAVQNRTATGRGSSKKIELYGVKKLRELILELAVRGKLVPQNPEDEPASVLLERIAADNARLVKEKKTKKPNKLVTATREDISFDLPTGWGVARFSEIFELEYGNNLPKDKRSNTGEYSVYGSNGVVGTHNDRSVSSPCIVIGRKGSAGALNLCLDNGCWVTDVAYSTIPPQGLDLRFTFLMFHTLGLDSLGKGIKPGLSRNEAYNLPVAIPPEKEQPRIVTKVNELMSLCDQLEQQTESSLTAHTTLVGNLLTTLTSSTDAAELEQNWQRIAEHFTTLFTTEESIDQLKQTVLQLAVMGKLVPQNPNDEPASVLLEKIAAEKVQLIKEKKIKKQRALPPISEDEKPFGLPVGWEWCRLDDLAFTSEAGWSPRCEPTPREGDKWGVLKVSAVTWGIFKPEENKELPQDLEARPQYEVKAGDFLISRANTAELVARAVVVPADVPKHLMMSDKIIRFEFSDKVSSHYINLANNSSFSRTYYASVAGGTSSSMKNVSRHQVRNLVVAVPPYEEELRIISKVKQLSTLCNQLKTHLQQAQQTRLHLADAMVEQALI